MNKFLFVISLMLIFFSSAILAMETDAMEIDEIEEMETEIQTKSFYHIQNATGTIGTIEKSSKVLNELQKYNFFKKAPGTGEKNNPKCLNIKDDPNVLNTTKSFQFDLFEKLDLFKKTKTVDIQTSDNKKFKLFVLSTLFNKSKALEKILTTGMKERTDVIEGKPLVFGDINSTKLKLVVGIINNIANLSKYFADKNIGTIYTLLEAASFLDIEDIVSDVVLRLSQSPNHFNEFFDFEKYAVFSNALYAYENKIKDKLFNFVFK